ncbi:hypothetical protein ACHAXS_014177 [Conticribra weissflogii]
MTFLFFVEKECTHFSQFPVTLFVFFEATSKAFANSSSKSVLASNLLIKTSLVRRVSAPAPLLGRKSNVSASRCSGRVGSGGFFLSRDFVEDLKNDPYLSSSSELNASSSSISSSSLSLTWLYSSMIRGSGILLASPLPDLDDFRAMMQLRPKEDGTWF